MSRTIPLRLQKYLLPLESNVPPSSCYASAYLEVKIRNADHNKELSEIVSRTNQRISQNVQRLREGYYDHDVIPFSLEPCYPLQLDLPYEILTDINISNPREGEDITDLLYDKYFKGRSVSPANLNCQEWWPQNFKFIGSKIRTSDFHVSLLPLIRFDSDSQLTHFRNQFEEILRRENPSNADIPVKFATTNGAPSLEVLPKHDYNKFFLGLRISRQERHNYLLNRLQMKLARDLRQDSYCRGHVIGEIDDSSIVDWGRSLLHMSVGVCNRGEGCIGFGQNELFYLNKKLLFDDGEGINLQGEQVLEGDGRVVLMLSGGKLVY